MLLECMGINQTHINALYNRGIYTAYDLVRVLPKSYYDLAKPLELVKGRKSKGGCIIGTLIQVTKKFKNGRSYIAARVKEERAGNLVFISWIGYYDLYGKLKDMLNHKVMVIGKLDYSPEYDSFSMLNPYKLTLDINGYTRILPVYPNIKNIEEDWLKNAINKILTEEESKDAVDRISNIYNPFNFSECISDAEALRLIHCPEAPIDIANGYKRLIYDDMLYFTARMELNNRKCNKETSYCIKSMRSTVSIIKELPYELTDTQKATIKEITDKMKNGVRINALIQGDVGSGKTIIAILLMLAMADSGYQSAIMAPTEILASQHYVELSKYAEKYGYKVAFLKSKLKTVERRKLLEGIQNGDYQLIVGTTAVIGKTVEYHNLALAITDEEHKFGLIQRNTFTEKVGDKLHTITMSATPIPRTLAESIYGNNLAVYTIAKPGTRKEVKTFICNSNEKIFDFIRNQLAAGRQAYVVCSVVKELEDSNITSLKEMTEKYERAFPDTNIASVSGKTAKADADIILKEYARGKYQILIATTIIEVGINIPNASVIVIADAESHGIATLHQLRGRVGRGKYQSYCVLQSTKTDNKKSLRRLNAVCSTTDGYVIANEDLKERGTGDLLGTKQSGDDKYVNIMLARPTIYANAKNMSFSMLNTKQENSIMETIERNKRERERKKSEISKFKKEKIIAEASKGESAVEKYEVKKENVEKEDYSKIEPREDVKQLIAGLKEKYGV